MTKFRIAIFTDTHLGYNEKDIVQREDSFNAFSECLQQAQLHNCDIILHSGDLFNDKNPSMHTLISAMKALNQYVIGEGNPPEITYAEGLSLHPNWLDPNIKIKIPFFCIHGNHDAPVGLTEPLSAVQILSIPKYINYFKDITKEDDIYRLEPVVLKRDNIRIIIYGFGWISEIDFIDCIKFKKLQLVPPPSDTDATKSFRILMVHQNATTYGEHAEKVQDLLSNALPNDSDENKIDLVIWGHEHENLVEPRKYGNIMVTQPGSTIYTQIRKKDATPRSMAILEIDSDPESKYEFRPYVLSSRKFIYREIELDKIFKGTKTPDDKIRKIEEEINSILAEENVDENDKPIMKIVLISHNMETNTLSLSSIYHAFQNKIANHQNFIKIMNKSVKDNNKEPKKSTNNTGPTGDPSSMEKMMEEDLDAASFQIIPLEILTQSFQQFIHGDDSKAFETNVETVFNGIIKHLNEMVIEKPNNMSSEEAKSFIKENKAKLPVIKPENPAEIQGEKKTSAKPSPTKPKQRKEVEVDDEEKAQSPIVSQISQSTRPSRRPKRK